jgi:ArsR family transcriptional regulator, arsenate/arsenite/antimonite-responsive transcriptional repressor
MGLSKKAEFSIHQQRLAEYLKAISHPARLAILKTLADNKECICGEIVDVLPLAQSTVSQHLKALKEVGLVKGEIDGPRSCYCIDLDGLKEMETMFSEFIKLITKEVKL